MRKNSDRLSAVLTFILTISLLSAGQTIAQDWKVAGDSLKTRWANEVSPDNVHSEYPRPQMAREQWQNLNGLWDYAIKPKSENKPENFDDQILVPFCVESALSGVMKTVGPENKLWYRRTFTIAKDWEDKKILLHFGAVDWQTTVSINGKEIGSHKGGYDPFTFDITAALKKGENELIVEVFDPTDASTQPRGKQVRKPSGIWYTAVTGIWQTVWLEPVPKAYIRSIKIEPDIDNNAVYITVDIGGDEKLNVHANATIPTSDSDNANEHSGFWGKAGQRLRISIPSPKLWSPDSPYLYDLEVTLYSEGLTGNNFKAKLDSVKSYFGMRKIALAKDDQGINRLFLNNKSLFQYGPLDQGWWPDGLYTAPSDEALRYDIEITKELGFNMLRKHVKVEPARFYYHCDKLGVLVWQDMPSGDGYIGPNDPDFKRSPESAAQFDLELKNMIDAFYNSPSIVMWVPFNEGWGQSDTERVTNWVKGYDPSRLVNSTSGWADRGIGDVHDIHSYPGPAKPANEEKRAAVLGEFGGLGLPVEGHTWLDKGNWGYRSYENAADLTKAYLDLMQNLRPLIYRGLAAAVYTQTTDVEIEVNGLLTYDRDVIKMDIATIAAANNKLYLPPPVVKTVAKAADSAKIKWQYTTEKPADNWQIVDFDDSAWKTGTGGFGTKDTPGAIVGTEWNTSDIWIRRVFDIDDKKLGKLYLNVHHDEDAKVYINGVLAADLTGWTSSYTLIKVSKAAQNAIKLGKNTIAIHCRQTTGGQYIDAGLVEIIEQD